jgi:hypothetical protein
MKMEGINAPTMMAFLQWIYSDNIQDIPIDTVLELLPGIITSNDSGG